MNNTPAVNEGIRNHAGQILLIQHILLTDKTMSQNSRDILEMLIGNVNEQ